MPGGKAGNMPGATVGQTRNKYKTPECVMIEFGPELSPEYIVRCWVWGLLKMLHRDFVSSAVHFLGVKKHAGS